MHHLLNINDQTKLLDRWRITVIKAPVFVIGSTIFKVIKVSNRKINNKHDFTRRGT